MKDVSEGLTARQIILLECLDRGFKVCRLKSGEKWWTIDGTTKVEALSGRTINSLTEKGLVKTSNIVPAEYIGHDYYNANCVIMPEGKSLLDSIKKVSGLGTILHSESDIPEEEPTPEQMDIKSVRSDGPSTSIDVDEQTAMLSKGIEELLDVIKRILSDDLPVKLMVVCEIPNVYWEAIIPSTVSSQETAPEITTEESISPPYGRKILQLEPGGAGIIVAEEHVQIGKNSVNDFNQRYKPEGTQGRTAGEKHAKYEKRPDGGILIIRVK